MTFVHFVCVLFVLIESFLPGDGQCFSLSLYFVPFFIRRKRIIGQNAGMALISLLFQLASQTGELIALTGLKSVWTNFVMDHQLKKKKAR